MARKRIVWNHNVRVYDEKPTTVKASYRQRTRWAQGHWFVTFRNSRKVLQAMFKGRVSPWEALSIFTYMYSLTISFVVVIFQFLAAAAFFVFDLIQTAGSQDMIEAVTKTAQGGWLPTLLSGLLFIYSFFFMFYLADWMDNKVTLKLRTLPKLVFSFIMNMVLATCSQIVGLFRCRRQNQWVKTEHKIKRLERGKELHLPVRPMLLPNAAVEPDDVPIAKASAK